MLKLRLLLFAGCLAGNAFVPPAQACGPDFPNRYLDAPEGKILASPEAVFAHEVERIASLAFQENHGEERECSGDNAIDEAMAELRAVLDVRGIPAGATTLSEAEKADVFTMAAYDLGREASVRTERSERRSDDERRQARAEAVKWFRLTRDLVAAGATDKGNLARESLGWEAFAEFQTGNFVPAIRLYLRHHRSGDPTAINSLRFVMRRLFRDETWRKNGLGEKLAHDPQARLVWTAWLLAQTDRWGGWDETENMRRMAATAQDWAEMLNKAGVCNVPEADRFAWVAYQGSHFALAGEWVRLAPVDSGVGEWIRGKLALRAGDLAGGERHLRAAATSRDLAAQRPVILGELGRVLLARDQPVEALAAWVSGGHWEDAAYVAERVLSLEELRAWVDRGEVDPVATQDATMGDVTREAELRSALRHLLARRLMRANRPADAEIYFPQTLRPLAREYVADVRVGFDLKRSDKKRAAAFWRAAKTAREQGMELLGTELEPDWAIWGGNFDTGSAAADRFASEMQASGTFAATKEELERVAEHAVPEKRFHYRYRAAQLAWWAAALMPNNSEETAAVLNEAGGWLKNRDPKAAAAFYQALAIRCGRTELGRKAAERRWFPDEAKAPDS